MADPTASFRLDALGHSRSSASTSSSSSSSSSSASSSSGSGGSSRRQQPSTPFLFGSSTKGKARQLDGGDDEDEEGPFVDPEVSSSDEGEADGTLTPARTTTTGARAGSITPTTAASPTTTFLSPEAGPSAPLLPVPSTTPSSSSAPLSASSRARRRRRDKGGQGRSLRDRVAAVGGGGPRAAYHRLGGRERALWEWVNVDDLDSFLGQVYEYYRGKGLFCILLARGLNLLTVGFVIAFSSFLLRCVDYSALVARSGVGEPWALDEVLVPRCALSASPGAWLLFLVFLSFYAYQIAAFALSIRPLLATHRFFTHLLEIRDEDVQTTSWAKVVAGIEGIREANSATSVRAGGAGKLDAHDIANRLMRQENYLIALLSPTSTTPPASSSSSSPVPPRTPTDPRLSLSLAPFLPPYLPAALRHKQWLTRVVVWNLRFCLLGFLFDGGRSGEVRRGVLRGKGNRAVLAEALRRRLRFMGCVNALLGPAIAVYLVVYSFFRYFEEYHKNPSSIAGRTYTPHARWLFREFNELPHVFEKRLDGSSPIARKYVDQFPKERTAIVMRFVSFIAGSFAAVLLVLSILDPSALLSLEITPHRTVLFYLTVFGGILAVTRSSGGGGSSGEGEARKTYDPEVLMRGVEWFTHWMPDEWEGRLHTTYVLDDFSRLFTLKLGVFATELASVFAVPFLLWYALPAQAEDVVDLFREFTVQVDGVGHVCAFAVFDFGRAAGGGARAGGAGGGATRGAEEAGEGKARARARKAEGRVEKVREREASGGKMERSFLNFKANNPEWVVQDPTSSIFLSRLQEQHSQQSSHLFGGTGARPTRALGGPAFLSPSASRAPGHLLGAPQYPSSQQQREGVMLSSHFLAEHNVPAYGPALATSPYSTPHGFMGRAPSSGGGPGKPPARGGWHAPPLREEEFEEEREGGWDDVTGTTGGGGQRERDARAAAADNEAAGQLEEGVGGQDQDDLLRMLGNIYTTRIGR